MCDVDSKNLDNEKYNFQYLKFCDMHQIAMQGTLKQQVQYENHIGDRPLLVVPICIWGDATHIDAGSRFKLEPISFSPLIFNETAR